MSITHDHSKEKEKIRRKILQNVKAFASGAVKLAGWVKSLDSEKGDV